MDYRRHKSRYCPVCYGFMRFNKETKAWNCKRCSYAVSEKSLLDGYIYWFCDNCTKFMNVQEGFTVESGIWKCRRCGYKNNVTENNIF